MVDNDAVCERSRKYRYQSGTMLL